MENRKHLIAKLVTNIIAQEFIKESIYGACLATAVLLHEQLKKCGVESNVVCGSATYKRILPISIHFWVVVDDAIYDPTQKITLHFAKAEGEEIDLNQYKYYPEKEAPSSVDDYLMLDIFREVKATNETDFYFKKAPDYIRRIKSRTNSKVNKLLKRYC